MVAHIYINAFLIPNFSNFSLFPKRRDKAGPPTNLQRPSVGQQNIYAVDVVPLVDNEPGPATKTSQTGTQASKAALSEDAEYSYIYDLPCDVNPDKASDMGHYGYSDKPSIVAENSRNSLALSSEVTPDYMIHNVK